MDIDGLMGDIAERTASGGHHPHEDVRIRGRGVLMELFLENFGNKADGYLTGLLRTGRRHYTQTR